ncbi:MAG: hypothetical protein NC908_01810 [Candidatus Omnitrophica bacterium]|nr:hypothetical protein [Candidatus Omnitrophota bacterium]
MRLKQYLKSLVRVVLLLNPIFFLCLIYGCSTSTQPTYVKENLSEAVQDICKKEYNLYVKSKLVGETLWVYLPLEDILTKSDKPEKYIDKFSIETFSESFDAGFIRLDYAIRAIPDTEKYQDYKYNEDVFKKINILWRVLRRIIFSLDRSKQPEPRFYCLVVADIKNGFVVKEIFYYLDIKKVSYEYISWGEYQHRVIQETYFLPFVIGDKEGRSFDYEDITLKDFILAQIQHRIKLKFQKPEVDKNVDIDKEILKIVAFTIKTYEFKEFYSLELNNLITQNRILLNQTALLNRPID